MRFLTLKFFMLSLIYGTSSASQRNTFSLPAPNKIPSQGEKIYYPGLPKGVEVSALYETPEDNFSERTDFRIPGPNSGTDARSATSPKVGQSGSGAQPTEYGAGKVPNPKGMPPKPVYYNAKLFDEIRSQKVRTFYPQDGKSSYPEKNNGNTPRPSYGVTPQPAQPRQSYDVTPQPAQPRQSYGVTPQPPQPRPSYGVPPQPAQPRQSYGVTPQPAQPRPSYGVPPQPAQPRQSYGVTPQPAQPRSSYGVNPQPAQPAGGPSPNKPRIVNGLVLQPDGSSKLGPEFKGVYVPNDMADAILKWTEQFKKDNAEEAKLSEGSRLRLKQSAIQFEHKDTSVDTRTINNIINKIAGIAPVEEGPWDPKAKEVFDKCLELHNKFRAIHYADPVQYDERITKLAQSYAQKLLKNVIANNSAGLQHSYYNVSGVRIGENLAWHCDRNHDQSAKSVVENAVTDWYSENKRYHDYGQSEPKNSNSKEIGHFTALVWRDTRYIGLGMAKGKAPDGNTHYVVVVNYDPAGNVHTQYKENVLEPGKYGPGNPPPALVYQHASIFPDHSPVPKYRADPEGRALMGLVSSAYRKY